MDADSLSRLAVGRYLDQRLSHGDALFGGADPFLFSTARPWRSSEWLSDLLWHHTHELGGELALVLLPLALVALGLLLAATWALRCGASGGATLAVVALAAPLWAERVVARGEIHALWALPCCGLLLWRALDGGEGAKRRRLLLLFGALPAAAALWGQLHGSVVLLPLLFAAAALQAWRRGQGAMVGTLALSGALCATLPLLGPAGAEAYLQALEHLRGAGVYRELLREWQPAWVRGGILALLSLGALGLVALLGSLRRWRLREAGGELLLLAAALVAAWASSRLALLLIALALPALSLAATSLLRAPTPRWGPWLRRSVAVAAAAAATLTMSAARLAPRPPVLEHPRELIALVARLEAPRRGSPRRIVAPYDRGPWLLHLGEAPTKLQLYLDPRNSRGAPALARWRRRELLDPATLLSTGARAATHVLVEVGLRRQASLARYLTLHGEWRRQDRAGAFVLFRRVSR